MKSNRIRNNLLPLSEKFNTNVGENGCHDCRPKGLRKNRLKKNLFDVSLFASDLDKTKTSLNLLYPYFLAERNHHPTLERVALSSQEHFEETLTERKTNSKIIKERKLNNNDKNYGNLIWPRAIATTYAGEILCVDSNENRILIFNSDFIFRYQLGCEKASCQEGQFDEPVDIIINELGRLYVADKNNFRIQVFNETKILRNLGTKSNATNFLPYKSSSLVFKFSEAIELNDKPIRLTSAPLSSICACSTQNGFIYILNFNNRVINFLKLKNLDSIRNICLNFAGTQLIHLTENQCKQLYLKFYQIDSNSSENNNLNKKMQFLKKVKFNQEYLPGICLSKIGQMKLSLDLNCLIVFDVSNLNLLEFDLSGNFQSILLRAEDYLGNVLAFDFSSDRQHLVTVEADCNLDLYLSEQNMKKNKIKMIGYNFKIKTFKYLECECHKSMVNTKSRLTERSKSFEFNQTLTDSVDIFS